MWTLCPGNVNYVAIVGCMPRANGHEPVACPQSTRNEPTEIFLMFEIWWQWEMLKNDRSCRICIASERVARFLPRSPLLKESIQF
jgi:hypothetical protein